MTTEMMNKLVNIVAIALIFGGVLTIVLSLCFGAGSGITVGIAMTAMGIIVTRVTNKP